MTRGKTTSLKVSLTAAERRTLAAWQLATTMPAGRVRRGRIILLLAAGMSISQIAHTVGISRRHVYRWVARFQAQGCAGLLDRPRPGPWQTRRPAPAWTPTVGCESQGDDAGREWRATSPLGEPRGASVQSGAMGGRLPPAAVEDGATDHGPAP